MKTIVATALAALILLPASSKAQERFSIAEGEFQLRQIHRQLSLHQPLSVNSSNATAAARNNFLRCLVSPTVQGHLDARRYGPMVSEQANCVATHLRTGLDDNDPVAVGGNWFVAALVNELMTRPVTVNNQAAVNDSAMLRLSIGLNNAALFYVTNGTMSTSP